MTRPNPHLIQRLTAVQQALAAQRAGAVGMANAMAGSERETFLREFLQKVFPAHRRFATGVITDADSLLSGQVDIAVEYGFAPSFPMPGTEERLLLADSVAIVIEVKSDLSRQWPEVEATTRKVKALTREVDAVMTLGEAPPKKIPVLAVGYTGYATTDGIAKRLAATAEDARPDGVLSIDSGCFVGFGITAHGPLGLYALAIAINSQFSQLALAQPNLVRYVQD